MIKIQAKKAEAEERGITRDSYLFKDPEQSLRMPLAIVAFFTGLLAYLKSVLDVDAARPPLESPKGREQDPASIKPEQVALATSAIEPEQKSAENESEKQTEDGAQPRRSSGQVFSDLLHHESLPDFDRIAAMHARRQAEAQTFSSIPQNDNVRSSATDSPAGPRGGGGEGGFGGGSSGVGGNNGNPPTDAAANRTPRLAGPVRLPSLVQSHTLFIPMSLLLAGALDPDQDPLGISALKASAGTLKAAEGGWLYTPAVGHLGPVTFTYGVSDGKEKVAQTAFLDVVRAPPIVGTNQDDLLIGTQSDDEIQGRDGDDNIDSRAGSDTIFGGAGDDHIVAGSGNDIVYAGLGNDLVFGGAGNDIIFGGAGHDRLFGDAGDDVLHGEDGDDLLIGGSGSDQLLGAAGGDILHGDEGRDHLDGGDGDDRLFGGAGADILVDGRGSDVVDGDDGDDVVLASTDQASDAFEGGAGFDTLSYDGATEAVTVDLAAGSASGLQTGNDSIAGFEGVVGGSGGDTLKDGAGSNVIDAGSGDDLVVASTDAANDAFMGGHGRDTLSYSSATGDITFDLVAGKVEGAEIGADTISGFEAVVGGKGDDIFLVGGTPMVLSGGEGEDTFTFGDMIARPGDKEASRLVHEIDDLEVGDRIIYKSFELRRLSVGEEDGPSSSTDTQDRFTDAYAGDDDKRPFRFRNETRDDEERTFIDVIGDPTQPDEIHFTIDVRGYQRFEYFEHA